MACSVNLQNPAHLDVHDGSESFATWVSGQGAAAANAGKALAWFLLPDHGIAIAIEMGGVSIRWDGRAVSHATGHLAEPDDPDQVPVYSLFAAASGKLEAHEVFLESCEASRWAICRAIECGRPRPPLAIGARVVVWAAESG